MSTTAGPDTRETAPETHEETPRSPLARRQRVLTAVALVAALVSTTGLILATRIKSPQQVAAETEAPEASLLTAEVVEQTLQTTVAMRGKPARGRQFPFTPISVARTANGAGGSLLIVTAVKTKAGARVKAGKVLVEVSERPVYALEGAFPAYRDMLPGQTGKDIAQLQSALRDLGYRSGDRKGYFGEGTKRAVRRFYEARGYAVPVTDGEPAAQPPANPSARPTQQAPAAPEAGPAQPRLDPMVPMSEVAFLPSLPAQVSALPARVGDQVAVPLISFTSGGLSLIGQLGPESEQLIEAGMPVEVSSEVTGYESDGTIESIGKRVTQNDKTYLPVRVTRSGGWPSALEGEDLRITVTTASSDGDVLAVPEAAVSSSADGRTTVTVVAADGRQSQVEVIPGVSAAGMVAVEAVDGTLRAGDRVVTGADGGTG
ncbi:peptidoglycan-binding protein [Actinoplanes sp. GCM10030250]|uniref:peptidoglycan-binding protein n=1 Tax=Actinoplanes sp. GCM10030250 TaxID=3273376 RepID=UPI00361C5B79